ncbi:complex I NDUFA9 subunit family protein [Geomesophilobacter sediminis]|uniref:Complex I NDUFA9 subunit family protein n=1 Tax=Geomesophilobacter sediminis TaxID=2798584 RepID=A0A8J7J3Z3_9BACT|nr:complex I NDUFA9 subunit family protein [Geomesophilobacter sediminis]MBJ6725443.1 complex I NDUFA9 subunit family protein [Geomesophilobacter sediminis]
MKVFLTGGTGFVGRHVRKALLSRGHTIKLLVHRKSGALEPGEEEVSGDVGDAFTFSDAVRGCDATINLVGIIREFPGRGMTFNRLHVEATKNVILAAKGAGVTRHLQMSALGTSKETGGGYFRTKWQAEEEVRQSGLGYTIFRPSIIFGPEDDFVNQLAGIIRTAPVMPIIGDGEYPMQPISGDDVARCFAEALEKPETVGQTYELCGPDRMSYNELVDTIGRAMGKTVLKVKSPLFLMKLVVPLLERVPFFPITSDQLGMLIKGSVCDCSWQKTFTFEPQHFAEGIGKYLKRT